MPGGAFLLVGLIAALAAYILGLAWLGIETLNDLWWEPRIDSYMEQMWDDPLVEQVTGGNDV